MFFFCVDIDECASSPCVNGDCVDEVSGYTCVCPAGYRGVLCDESKLKKVPTLMPSYFYCCVQRVLINQIKLTWNSQFILYSIFCLFNEFQKPSAVEMSWTSRVPAILS